ncbi:hypothetical protein AB1285_18295 [Microbacterium sp. NRRL B-14842]|uniref:hypothetical protein n=1 Tax=Microbacterium sp. NRRL B-14842 TaxID=3162881 RepID=UPI003D2CE2A5
MVTGRWPLHGYPSDLPLTDDGQVAENAWAFMPVFAYAAKALGFVLGSWAAGALVLSLGAGYLACLALHRLLRDRVGNAAALWAVVFFASGPLAALFQVGYAETLFCCCCSSPWTRRSGGTYACCTC